MKTSIKTIIFAFALSTLFAFNVSATDKGSKKATGFGTGIFASINNKIQINVDKYNKAAVTISLHDASGNLVYRESLGNNETKFRRLLDVSQLPSGSYKVQVASNGEKVIKTFEVSEKLSSRVVTVE